MADYTLAKDTKALTAMLKERMPSLKAVAARHMDPERLFRLVVANVSRTPALRECTIDSIFRSTLQAAELGLEPGSATGEGYLVPYRNNKAQVMECQFIPGYRGLISLAFRSGHVKNVRSHAVFKGDSFEFELGLEPKLRHIPNSEVERDTGAGLTHAYCIVDLKDGGILYDVMTRKEIDRIRGMSKSSDKGPWVDHYVEQARKTVVRRTLKYAPMSVELARAIAVDDHSDGFSEAFDVEFSDIDDGPQEETGPTKTDKVKGKISEPPKEPVTVDYTPYFADLGLLSSKVSEIKAKDGWESLVAQLKADGASAAEVLEAFGIE